MTQRLSLAALGVALALNGCAGGSLGSTASGAHGSAMPAVLGPAAGSPSGHISHIVLMIQENRSFDDFFATFPGADGATSGQMSNGTGGDVTQPLKEVNLAYPCDLGHSRRGFLSDYDGGKMDGFNLEGGSMNCPGPAGTKPYQYVNPVEIEPYWQIAQQYVLADHMFQTQGSGSFTAHQDLIAGGTMINGYESVFDFPTATPWGCDAPHGTTAPLLKVIYSEVPPYVYLKRVRGPFPCYNYATLRDLLDAKNVSWKYYAPAERTHSSGALWNAFDAIKAVRYGPEWYSNVTRTEKKIFTDISHRRLPEVSWVVPDAANSDHPGNGMSDTGPAWVANVINAIGESPYWKSTAIIVVWDDWGGFYDNVPPPFFDDYGGLGFRVPMLVVSPYTVHGTSSGGGYISHTQYEFGSILKFIENNWSLGQLGTTDTRATSIIDCFDFTQQPHKFVPIPVNFSRSYFEHQAPSYQPVDTE